MSSELYSRQYSVTLGSIRVTGLRVEFKATKSLEKEPNALDMKITNLARTTRDQFKGKGVPVIVTAGYPGNEAVIFSGDSRTIDHIDTGQAEFITHVQCGDGERAYRYARFSAGFGPGTAVVDVIRACAKSTSLNLGNLEDALAAGGFRGNLSQFSRGFTAKGKSMEVFDQLMKTVGFTWSIQSGALQILKAGKAVSAGAVLISRDTGMVGSPDSAAPDKKGGKPVTKVKTLLQPQVHCGRVIKIESQGVNGQFVVQKLEHEGDSHGNNWFTNIEATPL